MASSFLVDGRPWLARSPVATVIVGDLRRGRRRHASAVRLSDRRRCASAPGRSTTRLAAERLGRSRVRRVGSARHRSRASSRHIVVVAWIRQRVVEAEDYAPLRAIRRVAVAAVAAARHVASDLGVRPRVRFSSSARSCCGPRHDRRPWGSRAHPRRSGIPRPALGQAAPRRSMGHVQPSGSPHSGRPRSGRRRSSPAGSRCTAAGLAQPKCLPCFKKRRRRRMRTPRSRVRRCPTEPSPRSASASGNRS